MLSVKVVSAAVLTSVAAFGCGASPSEAQSAQTGQSQDHAAPNDPGQPHAAAGHSVSSSAETAEPPTNHPPETGTPSKPEEPIPPLPEGTTILHVGDSFAGALGIELNRELKKAGVKGVLHFQTSSYIPTWAWSKELDLYLLRTNPDLVLISLGANELEVPDPQQRVPAIEKIVKRIGDRPCVWVAPPLWQGARAALLDVIREHCTPCVYMDSAQVVPDLPRARDKIHPSMEARKMWAREVLEWLARRRDPSGAKPWALRSDESVPATSN